MDTFPGCCSNFNFVNIEPSWLREVASFVVTGCLPGAVNPVKCSKCQENLNLNNTLDQRAKAFASIN